jgi:hypothetical protein
MRPTRGRKRTGEAQRDPLLDAAEIRRIVADGQEEAQQERESRRETNVAKREEKKRRYIV